MFVLVVVASELARDMILLIGHEFNLLLLMQVIQSLLQSKFIAKTDSFMKRLNVLHFQ